MIIDKLSFIKILFCYYNTHMFIIYNALMYESEFYIHVQSTYKEIVAITVQINKYLSVIIPLVSTLLVRLSLYATFSWELSVADCCLFPLIEQDPAAGCAEFCLSSRQIRRMSRAISVISTMSVCFTIENIKELLYAVLYLHRGVSCQGAILQSGKYLL